MKRIISFVLCILLVLSVMGCESKKETVDQAADPTINLETAKYWREILQKYRDDDAVHQVLLVRYTGGCNANAQYFVKNEHNNAWELEFESIAWVGKHGIGKTGEGDGKAPIGDFGVTGAFGILENPGTSLDYIDVKPTTYACDEEGPYYNQVIDTAETGHACKGEEMFHYSPEYNYGLTTDYNSENVYPNGSAIFVHVKGLKGFTGGCIALDQDDMETILKTATAGMRVVIGEN